MKTSIEVDLKWFCFRQNNSGGRFDVDDNVAHYVFIQARNADEAWRVGSQFMDNSNSCPCCGDRWSNWIDDSDGTDEPMCYETPVREKKSSWWEEEARRHYFDGRKESIVIPKEEK